MAVKVSVVMAETNCYSKACVLLSNLGNGSLAVTGIFHLLNFHLLKSCYLCRPGMNATFSMRNVLQFHQPGGNLTVPLLLLLVENFCFVVIGPSMAELSTGLPGLAGSRRRPLSLNDYYWPEICSRGNSFAPGPIHADTLPSILPSAFSFHLIYFPNGPKWST